MSEKNTAKNTQGLHNNFGCFVLIILIAIAAMFLLKNCTGDRNHVPVKTESEQSAELEKRKAARETKRIENQFSAWDGSHPELTRIIKEQMNDPDSYQHVETRFKKIDDSTIDVYTTFRGKNKFGGVITKKVYAKVDFFGNVKGNIVWLN